MSLENLLGQILNFIQAFGSFTAMVSLENDQ